MSDQSLKENLRADTVALFLHPVAATVRNNRSLDEDLVPALLEGIDGRIENVVSPNLKKFQMPEQEFQDLRWMMDVLKRLCCKPDVGVSQIRTTTVLSSCFCVGQTVL